jgi:hypothetical protein
LRKLKAQAGSRKSLCGLLLHSKVGDALDGTPVAELLFPGEVREDAAAAAVEIRDSFAVADERPVEPGMVAATVSN